MVIKCEAWNPSIQETMRLDRWGVLECYKDPVNAMDHEINSVIRTLRTEGCNPDVKTTITLPLDEYRLLISEAQKKAKEEGCKEGQKEAWDLARRIIGTDSDAYSYDEVYDVFGTRSSGQILNMPVKETLDKDKKHQEEKEALHIGDEVEFIGSNPNYKVKVNELITGYVVGFEDGLYGESCVRILAKHGSYLKSHEMCEKTGKHNPDIEKVMASFEEEESE